MIKLDNCLINKEHITHIVIGEFKDDEESEPVRRVVVYLTSGNSVNISQNPEEMFNTLCNDMVAADDK
jgi:hypothetical protein